MLATYTYDDLGRRRTVARGNGSAEVANFDTLSRLTQLAQDLQGSGQDVTFDYSYNHANQIVSRTGNNTAYNHPTPSGGTISYSANHLSRYTAVGGVRQSYDVVELAAFGDSPTNGRRCRSQSIM